VRHRRKTNNPSFPLSLKRGADRGFIVSNFAARFPEGVKQLAIWVGEGRLSSQETIVKGFEKLPEAFIGLFEGKNTGKSLVEIE